MTGGGYRILELILFSAQEYEEMHWTPLENRISPKCSHAVQDFKQSAVQYLSKYRNTMGRCLYVRKDLVIA